jgi:hypothetical protein
MGETPRTKNRRCHARETKEGKGVTWDKQERDHVRIREGRIHKGLFGSKYFLKK